MNDDDLPDLLAWRVPPPPQLDARSLVMRALTPAIQPARRRLRWLVAALVLGNAVLAALLVIVLARPAAKPATVVVPAGEVATDLRVQQLLAKLASEEAQLQGKLADLEQMRAVVLELQAQVDRCEHARTVPKQPPTPVAPSLTPPVDTSCDEVSCVLNDYPAGCCDKYKKTAPVPPPPPIPDALDRTSISNGVNSVKSRVAACATTAPAKGTVKLHVRVADNGLVTNVDVIQTPDPALGACVAAAMERAVFARTKQGGTFSYPFVF